ncbi:hypothetical protein LCGC14_0768680 [marine sediment metagenome]|uniref:Uncharacterized protein n=1 Tax=marine sediment metagenome TaxID=412755 RepID=A0A0F9PZ44_9ZZZZ
MTDERLARMIEAIKHAQKSMCALAAATAQAATSARQFCLILDKLREMRK